MTEHFFKEIREKFKDGFFKMQNNIIPELEVFELGYEQNFHVKIKVYNVNANVNIVCNVVSENPLEVYYEVEDIKFEESYIGSINRMQKQELEDIMNN